MATLKNIKKVLKHNNIKEDTLKQYLKAAFRCGLLTANQFQTVFVVKLEGEMDIATDEAFEQWYQYFLTVNNQDEEE